MKLSRIIFSVGILALVVFCASPASADEGKPWPMYPVEKLSRGIANAAFGVLEIPAKWYDVTTEKGGIAGLTYGTLKGVCYFIAREVVGVIDVATFLIPLPGCPDEPNSFGWGYGPIMTPAWVIDVEHDWNNFIYDQDTMASPVY